MNKEHGQRLGEFQPLGDFQRLTQSTSRARHDEGDVRPPMHSAPFTASGHSPAATPGHQPGDACAPPRHRDRPPAPSGAPPSGIRDGIRRGPAAASLLAFALLGTVLFGAVLFGPTAAAQTTGDYIIFHDPPTAGFDEGTSTTYRVSLVQRPSSPVGLLAASNDKEVVWAGTSQVLNSQVLLFDANNWNTPQAVSLTSVRDNNGTNELVTITHTLWGGGYVGEYDTVPVTIRDLDHPGVTVSKTVLTVDEGASGTYAVKLDTKPSGRVTVMPSSVVPGISFPGGAPVFTADDWNTLATVTVSTTRDDNGYDDEVRITHAATGTAAEYDGIAIDPVTLNTTDLDTPGITRDGIKDETLTLAEGDTHTYSLRLDTRPRSDVTIAPSSDHASVTVTGALTFTRADWREAQFVTLSATVDDDAIDGTATITHAVSSTGNDYADRRVADIVATATDADEPGLTVEAPETGPDEGGTAEHTVALATRPSAAVTVTPSSGDASVATVDGAPLTFTTTDWSTPQTVTITGAQDDNGADDTATITYSATGGDYASVTAETVVTVTDDDEPGVTVELTALTLAEEATATYTVELDTEPSASVTVTPTSGNAAVATASDALTFTADDWDAPQTLTATGIRDPNGHPDTTNITHAVASDDADYDGGEASAVSITVTDIDTPGVTVSDEAVAVVEGADAFYTVQLDTQPRHDVTVTPTATAAEGSHGTATASGPLTFTAANWNAPQTVTVSGNDDADGASGSATITHAASSTDTDYDGATVAGVSVTVTDDDERELLLSRTATEIAEGAAHVHAVALSTKPTITSGVLLSIVGDAATASPPLVVFDAADWAAPKEITISAAQDDDGRDEVVTIVHIGYGDYAGVSGTITVTVTDDEEHGVTVEPTALTPAEGIEATYAVQLATEPFGPVTVTPSSTDEAAATVTGPLTFTAADWNTPQTVTVSTEHDADGADDTAAITHAVTSTDPDYDGLTAPSVSVTVDDDEVPGVTISAGDETWGANATLHREIAENASFTYAVQLDTRPTAPVTVLPSPSAPDAATVSFAGDALVFDASNWNTPQTVTVSGKRDPNGYGESTLVLHTLSGAATEYEGATLARVLVLVTDIDTPAFAVTGATDNAIAVTEGATATYAVQLATEPRADVTLTPSVTATAEPSATVSGPLTFTTENWDAPQAVTVTGAQDADDDNDSATIEHAASSLDPDYRDATVADIAVTVTDDDEAEIRITEPATGPPEGGTATYTVALATRPMVSAAVLVLTGGNPAATVSPPLVIFSADDWAVPQTVTVFAAQDEDGHDDEVAITHIGQGEYAGVSGTITVTVTDDEQPGVSASTSEVSPKEDATATYALRLDTEPLAPVTITPTSADEAAATASGPLTFTAADWTAWQTVTVTGAPDDDGANDKVLITHAATSTDTDYDNIDAAPVLANVTDTDEPRVTVSVEEMSVTEGISATYTVELATRPSAPVTIRPSSGKLAAASVSDDLTFEPTTWNTPQTITVYGTADNNLLDQTSTVTHAATSDDADYQGITIDDVTVVVEDPDEPSVTVSTETLTVPEDGTATYTVVLDYAPTDPVTITPTAGDETVATVSGPLVFNPANWSLPRTITVTGVSDEDGRDGDATISHVATGDRYNDVAIPDATVTVDDADVPGVTVSVSEMSLTEGDLVTYVLELRTQPSANVTITPSSGDPAALSVFAEPVFEPITWNVPQTVVVSGSADHHDSVLDQTVTITHAATSTDADYRGITIDSVIATVGDPDGPSITVSHGYLRVREGGTNTYTVVLDHAPSGPVTITPTLDDATVATVSAPLMFTQINWSQPQTITISTVEDTDAHVESARISHSATGGGYASATLDTVRVRVEDIHAFKLVLSTFSVTIREGQDNDRAYSVRLSSRPLGDVTVTHELYGDPRLTVGPSALTFSRSNWSKAQWVTIEAPHDEDGRNNSSYIHHTAFSGNYRATIGVSVRVTDDDLPELSITSNATASEGDHMLFQVHCAGPANGDVTVQYATSDGTAESGTDYSAAEGTLTIARDYGSSYITVPVSTDDLDEGSETLTLTLSNPSANARLPGDASTHSVIGTIMDSNPDGNVEITVSSWPQSIVEGGSATYEVRLDRQISSPELRFAAGITGGGIKLKNHSLRFTPSDWDTPRTVTMVSAFHDEPGDVDVTITHSLHRRDDSLITTLNMPLTITDNELPVVDFALQDRGNRYRVNEHQGPVEIPLTLSPAATADVTVKYRRTPDIHTIYGQDYERETGVLTIGAGQTRGVITIPITDDNMYEVWESFYVHLEGTSKNAQLSHNIMHQDNSRRVIILDNDRHPAGIRLEAEPRSVREGSGPTRVTVTAVIKGDTTFGYDQPITVNVGEGGLSPTADFDPVPAFNIMIRAGETRQEGVFTVVPRDNGDADNEVIVINGAYTDEDGTYETTPFHLTLVNDGMPGVAISPTTVGVVAGGTASYRVGLESKPTAPVTISPSSVPYGLGTGDALTFDATNWNDPQTVVVTGRRNASGSHAVTHGVSGGNYAGVAAADVTVVNDAVPRVIAEGAEAYEDDGWVAIAVRLTKANNDAGTSVAYRTRANTAGPGVATAGSDFASTSGTLTFAAGDVEETIIVALLPDGLPEPRESFSLVLENASANAGFVGGPSVQSLTVPITIHNDDVEPTGIVLGVNRDFVREGDGTTRIAVTARPEGNSTFGQDVRVFIAVASDGMIAINRVPSFGVTIPAGASSATGSFSLTPMNDTRGNNGTVTVGGRTTKSGVSVSPAKIVLLDNDERMVTVFPSELTLVEGERASYKIAANRPLGGSRLIYPHVPSPLRRTSRYSYYNFSDSRRSPETVSILSPMHSVDADQTVNIIHSSDHRHRNRYPDSHVEVNIVNRKSRPLVQVPRGLSANEDDLEALIPVSISEPANRDVTMDYQVWDEEQSPEPMWRRHAFQGEDYIAERGVLTIPAGQTSVTATIRLIDDDRSEPTEHFRYKLYNFSPNVRPPQYYSSYYESTFSIQDNDAAPPGIALSVHPETLGEEDGPTVVTVTATVRGGTTYGEDKRMHVTVAGDGSGSATRFDSVPPFHVEIPDGEPSATATFTITPRDDNVRGDDVTVTVSGSDIQINTLAGDPDYGDRFNDTSEYRPFVPITSATLTITDDDGGLTGSSRLLVGDDVESAVVLPEDALTVGESDTTAYVVSLAWPPAAAVTVAAASEDPGAVVAEGILTFTEDDWHVPQTLTVAGVQDGDADNELVTVTHAAESEDPLYEGIAGSLVVAVVDDSAPVLGDVLMISTSTGDNLYGINEEIRLALAFSKPVRAEGAPRLRLVLGDHVRWAEHQGSADIGPDTLVFAYTVRADDRAGVIRVPANALRLGEGDAIVDAEVADISAAVMNEAVEFAVAVNGNRDTLLAAHAGEDFEVRETEAATLDGSASTSAEPLQMVYAWTQKDDDPVLVELNGADTATPDFTAPNLAGNTEVHFILTVSNPRTGDEDSDEVMVTILAVNDPPVADAGPDQVVDPGVMVTLDGTASSDPEEEPLSFAWVQAEDGTPRVELQDASTAMPTFRSLEIHRRDTPTTFVLTVTDPHGASDSDEVVVTTRAVDLSIVLRHALAGFGRSVASGLMDAVGGRFDNSGGGFVNLGGGASVRFADLAVPGTECGDAVSDADGGVLSQTSLPISMEEVSAVPNVHDEVEALSDAEEAAPSGDAQTCSPAMAWDVGMGLDDSALIPGLAKNTTSTSNTALNNQSDYADAAHSLVPTWGEHFGDRLRGGDQNRSMGGTAERAFRFGGGSKAPGEGPSWVMWGQGDGRRFESQPQPTMSLKGDVQSSYLGIDYRLGERVVAGVAVSMSEGWVEYEHGRTTGDVWMNLSGAYPYAHWQPTDGLGAWGMAGGGTGAARITTDAGRDENTAIAMRMAAFGLRQQLATVLGVDWSVKTDAFAVRIDSAATYGLKPVQADVHRARLVVEGRDTWNLSPSQQLRPSVELGGRVDGGDSESGHGMELGGGMEYANTALGLTVEARGRALVGHSSEDFEDWGASLRMEWTPVSLGGLSMSMSPSWGEAMSRTDAMWRSEWLLTGVTMGRDEASALNGWNPDQMDAELKYGFTLRALRLSPYGKFGLGNHGDRRRYGVRLEALDMRSGELRLDLFGEHNSPLEGGDANSNLGAEGTVRMRLW